MSSLLRRLFAAYRLELRLLCLHWTFPLLHGVWALFLFFVLRGMSDLTAESVLRDDVGPLAIGSVSLAALFVGAAAASRGARTKIADLELSYPTGAELLLGRWLATVTALLTTLILPLALALWAGPVSSFLRAAPGYLLDGVITFAFTAAVGWCAIVWLGNRRWVYPLLAAGWIAAASSAFFIDRRGFDRPVAALLDFMRANSGRYQELWGRLAERPLPTWFNLFYVGLALAVLALALGWNQRRRTRRLPALAAVVVLAGLTVALLAGARYSAIVNHWNATGILIDTRARPLTLARTDREVIDAWAIDADLRDLAQPRFDARVTLRNASAAPITDATLTLYHELAVTESSVALTRDGDQLRLSLPAPLAPGATTEIHLRYGGAFTVRTTYIQGLPQPTYFIQPDGVRLLPGVGWYPLAGLTRLDDLDRVDARAHAPGAFHLRVQVPADFGVTSNLPSLGDGVFAAEQATWAYLIATPRLRTARVGDVTVVAPEALLPKARTLAARYDVTVRRIAPFFPAPADGLTFAVLDSLPGWVSNDPPADGQLLVIVGAREIEWLYGTGDGDFRYIGSPVVDDLWMGATGIVDDPWFDVRRVPFSLQVFLWIYARANGDPAGIAAAIDDPDAYWHDAYDLTAVLALVDIYRERGPSGIQAIVDRLVAAPMPIGPDETPEEVAAWYREVAGVS